MVAQEFSFAPDSRKRLSHGGGGGALDSLDNWDDDFDLGLSSSKKSSTTKAPAAALVSKPMPSIKQPISFGSDFSKKKQQDDDFFGSVAAPAGNFRSQLGATVSRACA